MTHGALSIGRDDEIRKVLLYTVHSGYLIPEIIAKAPAFIAKHRFSFMGDPDVRERYLDRAEFTDQIMRLNPGDGLDYAPCVAGLLCAVNPWVLYPVPLNFMRDECHFPRHVDNPERLVLTQDRWIIQGENHTEISSFRPVDLVLDWTWNNIINKK